MRPDHLNRWTGRFHATVPVVVGGTGAVDSSKGQRMDGKSGGAKVNQENGGMRTTDGTCPNPECPTCPVVRGASKFGVWLGANKVTIKDGTVFNAKGQAVGTVLPALALTAAHVDPSTPDQMLDAKARAAATISASATRAKVDLAGKLIQTTDGDRERGPLMQVLDGSVTIVRPEVTCGDMAMNDLADRCQSLASESYLRLHEKVSIGRTIAMLQQSILDKQNTNRVIGVYLRNNHLTPEDGAAALALYQYGITGPELLDQAVPAAESRNRAGIKPDGGAA